MEVIKQIGILSKLGYAKKAIARELNLSKNTVKELILQKPMKHRYNNKTHAGRPCSISFLTLKKSLDERVSPDRYYGVNTD